MEKETEQVIVENKASSESTALVAIDTEGLNKESLTLINQIIAEHDLDKTKDLTYLFNINQNKKTMVRMDKLSELQDQLVGLLSKRVTERPDEMPNTEVMNALKIVQDILERGQKQIATEPEKPLIQINTQTNNIGGKNVTDLTRESRKKLEDFIKDVISTTAPIDEAPIIEAEVAPKLAEEENDD